MHPRKEKPRAFIESFNQKSLICKLNNLSAFGEIAIKQCNNVQDKLTCAGASASKPERRAMCTIALLCL